MQEKIAKSVMATTTFVLALGEIDVRRMMIAKIMPYYVMHGKNNVDVYTVPPRVCGREWERIVCPLLPLARILPLWGDWGLGVRS